MSANGVFATAADGSAKLVEDPWPRRACPTTRAATRISSARADTTSCTRYWDFGLVEKIAPVQGPRRVAAVLEKGVRRGCLSWKSAGDYHHWPEGWATESLAAARTAFAGITFGALTADGKGGIKRIAITLPPHYDDTCVPLATERLAKSAYHLAELLNAIHWAD